MLAEDPLNLPFIEGRVFDKDCAWTWFSTLKLCNWRNEKDKKADGGEPGPPRCEPVGQLATFLVENEDVSVHITLCRS